jgi:transcription elongation GreA/GreB family factor
MSLPRRETPHSDQDVPRGRDLTTPRGSLRARGVEAPRDPRGSFVGSASAQRDRRQTLPSSGVSAGMSSPQHPVRVDETRLFTSPAGRRRLIGRIERVRAAYDAVCASNGDAAEAGDNSVWHDNFDYEENQRQMHQLARRLRDLQDALRRMELVDAPQPHRARRLRVRGRPGDRRRAHRAPRHRRLRRRRRGPAPRLLHGALAQALMGAEPGDTRVVRVAGRTRELTVMAVEPARRRASCEPPRVIALEGMDGTGKSTLARALCDTLDACLLRTPPEALAPARPDIDAALAPSAVATQLFYGATVVLASDRARRLLARVARRDRSLLALHGGVRRSAGPPTSTRAPSSPSSLLAPDLTVYVDGRRGRPAPAPRAPRDDRRRPRQRRAARMRCANATSRALQAVPGRRLLRLDSTGACSERARRSACSRRWRDGGMKRPTYLRVVATTRCNHRCDYCHMEGDPHAPGTASELPTAHLIASLHAAVLAGVKKFKFLGGEPLLATGPPGRGRGPPRRRARR